VTIYFEVIKFKFKKSFDTSWLRYPVIISSCSFHRPNYTKAGYSVFDSNLDYSTMTIESVAEFPDGVSYATIDPEFPPT